MEANSIEAAELAKKIVRTGARSCVRCHMEKPLQGSHVYSVGAHPDMAALTENILPMCVGCHIYWWHKNPIEAFQWFAREFPDLFKRLEARAQITEKVDWKSVYEELKALAP